MNTELQSTDYLYTINYRESADAPSFFMTKLTPGIIMTEYKELWTRVDGVLQVTKQTPTGRKIRYVDTVTYSDSGSPDLRYHRDSESLVIIKAADPDIKFRFEEIK